MAVDDTATTARLLRWFAMGSDSLSVLPEALRLIRTRKGLTQTAASKRPGAPDFRTLSHWETRRKVPSLRLLSGYLEALGLDFSDLQQALDQVRGDVSAATAARLAGLTERLDDLADIGRRVETIGTALIELDSRIRELEDG